MKKLFLILFMVFTACSLIHQQAIIPNFRCVDSHVYRGGQPNEAGWEYLKQLGVQTVIKLNFESEGSDETAEKLGMKVWYFPIEPNGILDIFKQPDAWNIYTAAKILNDCSDPNHPAYIHCAHGEDRTGLVVGVYRVLYNGFTKDEAYKEMLKCGFHPELIGLQRFWDNFSPAKEEKE